MHDVRPGVSISSRFCRTVRRFPIEICELGVSLLRIISQVNEAASCSCCCCCSLMLRRRALVLRSGSRNQCVYLRERPQAFASLGSRKSSRNVKLSSLFAFSLPKVRTGVVVAKRRTDVTFGLAFGRRLSKVSTVTGIEGSGGSWSRNAERSSLLDLFGRRIPKVSTVTGIGGVLVANRRTGPHFWIWLFFLERGERTDERSERRGEKRGERGKERRDERRG